MVRGKKRRDWRTCPQTGDVRIYTIGTGTEPLLGERYVMDPTRCLYAVPRRLRYAGSYFGKANARRGMRLCLTAESCDAGEEQRKAITGEAFGIPANRQTGIPVKAFHYDYTLALRPDASLFRTHWSLVRAAVTGLRFNCGQVSSPIPGTSKAYSLVKSAEVLAPFACIRYRTRRPPSSLSPAHMRGVSRWLGFLPLLRKKFWPRSGVEMAVVRAAVLTLPEGSGPIGRGVPRTELKPPRCRLLRSKRGMMSLSARISMRASRTILSCWHENRDRCRGEVAGRIAPAATRHRSELRQ